MDNKIALVYLNGEYTVNINGTLMHKGNDAEEMFEKFQNVIKNNSIRETTSWEYIKDRINELNLREAKINEDYKTIEFQSIKYFHNINKLLIVQKTLSRKPVSKECPKITDSDYIS